MTMLILACNIEVEIGVRFILVFTPYVLCRNEIAQISGNMVLIWQHAQKNVVERDRKYYWTINKDFFLSFFPFHVIACNDITSFKDCTIWIEQIITVSILSLMYEFLIWNIHDNLLLRSLFVCKIYFFFIFLKLRREWFWIYVYVSRLFHLRLFGT